MNTGGPDRKSISVKWACPRCGAGANEHGKGACHDRLSSSYCEGLLCECEEETAEHHGESFEDPCKEAHCGHCGWSGTFPVKPKGLQAWEKKALDAGWSPPIKRAEELGL